MSGDASETKAEDGKSFTGVGNEKRQRSINLQHIDHGDYQGIISPSIRRENSIVYPISLPPKIYTRKLSR